ncbi:MAG TPA: glycoside hydrolase family 99-like domain-containing protein [Hanamia sp.]|nr:glycoside hydrolase family 99-like domain-containing protein [Hanamia sp.]
MGKEYSKLTRRGFIGNASVLASGIVLVPPPVSKAFQSFFPKGNKRKYTVAIYYWPNFHKDAFMQSKKGIGWTEWEVVKNAKPKFEGHYQPKIPLWGYRDESDPREMARNIDVMADAGIDSIIFDWYRYDDDINGGVMLEKALQEGFLKAPNRNGIKFSLMWANHDFIDCFPFAPGKSFENAAIWRKGEVGQLAFKRHTQDAIESYFNQPNYWLIKGCPYFSIYRLDKLIRGLGSIANTRDALQDFRARVKAAGFPDLHLNIVDSGATLTNEIPKLAHAEATEDKIKVIRDLLFEIRADSATMYTWVHHLWPMLVRNSEENKEDSKNSAFGFKSDRPAKQEDNNKKYSEGKANYTETEILQNAHDAGIIAVDYSEYGARAMKVLDERLKDLGVTYFPHVSMGWDGSPRNYSMGMVLNNSPKKWEGFLRETKSWIDQHPESDGIVTLNSWNEWVEGSYIEPDTVHGIQYLEAVRKVFGAR